MNLRMLSVVLMAAWVGPNVAAGQVGQVETWDWPEPTLAWAEDVAGDGEARGAGEMLATGEHEASAFARGSWEMQVYGSTAFGDDAGEIYLAHVGVGYYICDGFMIGIEGIVGGASINQTSRGEVGDERAAFAGGFGLAARWHFLRFESWSLYLDAVFGVITFSDPWPDQATNFNFFEQLGIGATVRLDDQLRLMGGVRIEHISNAGIDIVNPGSDSAVIYLGVLVPF